MPKFEDEPIKPMSMQEIVDSMIDGDAPDGVSPINPDSPLARALGEVTIFDLWQHFKLWGNPRQNPCCSPFRDDQKPSFSVRPDGKLWNDFGLGGGGGLIEFAMKCTRLSRSGACKWLIVFHRKKLRAGNFLPEKGVPAAPPAPSAKPLVALTTLPTLIAGTAGDHDALARSRKLSPETIGIAVNAGILRFCFLDCSRAWVVTDQCRFNAQARLLDGSAWQGGSKVRGFTGNIATWPIGLVEARHAGTLLLVEGTPDMLAGVELVWRLGLLNAVLPVCITGAGMSIHPQALQHFQGKAVRILPHLDKAGTNGARCWQEQLKRVAPDTTIVQLPEVFDGAGKKLKDLNNFVSAGHPWLSGLAALPQPNFKGGL